MNKNILFYGRQCTGKTTSIINSLKSQLKQRPNLKVGVWERYPEIKSQVPEVIAVNNPYPSIAEGFDLFVINGGFGVAEEREMITGVNLRKVPVWYEACISRENLENLYKIIPCLKEFDKVECEKIDGKKH